MEKPIKYRGATIRPTTNGGPSREGFFWIDNGVYSEPETAHFATIEQVKRVIDYWISTDPTYYKRHVEGKFVVLPRYHGIQYESTLKEKIKMIKQMIVKLFKKIVNYFDLRKS